MGLIVPVGHMGHNAGGGGGGVDLTSGLLVAWDLDVDLNDDGPNGYNLSTLGSPTLGTYNGRTGLQTSLGNHAYATAGTAPLLNELTEFTVAVWLSSGSTAAAGAINNAYAWSSQKRWLLNLVDIGAGNIATKFAARDATLGNFEATGTIGGFESTTWQHVILTVSETNKRAQIYVDNVLDVDFDFTGYTMQTGSNWGIGLGGDGDGNGTSSEMAVNFSRVYFWDHVFSADKRAAIYNGGADKKYADF